jgi:MarR family transcriptional regulator, organic hydroperoxide resistance regulator
MYRLTTSLPYLLNRLGVRMGTLFGRRIAPYDLTLPMYRVLAALSERADQKLGEISEMTTIDLSTMSRLIGSMVKMGLVSRVRLPNDERTVRINLTEKGAKLAVVLMQEAQHYEDVAIGGVKSSVIDKLKADLVRIYDALDFLESELVAGRPPTVNAKSKARSAAAAASPLKGARRSSGRHPGGERDRR